jgi:hypothetical protein
MSALDDLDLEALFGERSIEPDAPVRTRHETASPMIAAREPDAPAKSIRELFEDGVRAQVQELLQAHDVIDVIEIAVDGARVSLHGSVRDSLTSLLIEDLAWAVPAVRHCENHLRVEG